MNSPDTELINSIKNEIAQQYGGYPTFSELLKDNCKTGLAAAALSGIIDYVVLEFQRREEDISLNNKSRHEKEILKEFHKQNEQL